MPAIKKRITAEYLEREQQRNEQNGRGDADDRENLASVPTSPAIPAASPLKRKAPGPGMLKGLDGEVLMEKRKRTLPPAEQKLDSWLDNNLEKKAESTVSMVKLYQFYTDMCQQDASYVVELDVFKTMLHNKFGKEFGLQESSLYSGLVKESKPRKKPVVAPSLGYKMKDLVQEALKASGNPTKGMVFAWVKKFIAAKYPALQIEFRPHFLRKALDREINAGRVQLVKGIGFCGFYRLPGPPDVEEEPPKSKKKGGKKIQKTGETADSADDATGETEEDTEGEKDQAKSEEDGDEETEDKKKKKEEKSGEENEITEGGEEGETKKDEKKAKKKKKKTQKRKMPLSRHSNPLTLNDVFPLAMTYMAEPKEASFGRIKKYIEKYYGKADIDLKLKKCLEHGCDTGMWERMSGTGASGTFQLQVDSFNPQHTESMTDMICSAIIACTEPKVSSVRLLKSYISEYHPEFNIDTRPLKLRKALERAEKESQLRRISGIGMGGSFQLGEVFTPSPTILAGDEEEAESEYEVSTSKDEVYIIRKTKSGRRAPVEKTQLDFSSTYKRGVGSSGGKKKTAQRKPANRKSKYVDSSEEEEESSSEEEVNSEEESYRPRASTSRGGRAPASQKSKPPAAKKSQPKPKVTASKAKVATARGRGRVPSKPQSTPKRGRQAAKSPKKQVKEVSSEEEGNADTSTPRSTKSGRSSSGSNSVKKLPAKKRGQATKTDVQSDDEPNYYEVEEETVATPPKRGRAGKATPSKQKVAKTSPKKPAKRGVVESPTSSEARTPRSASKSARKSLRDMSSDEESEEEEYAARPSASRAGKKR